MSFNNAFADTIARRFGRSESEFDAKLAPFLNHRTIRRFTDEPISEVTLRTLIACAQSASTSSNLHLWSVVSVDEPARRAEIATLCAGQKQVVTAARFLIFMADAERLLQAGQSYGITADALDSAEFFTMAVVDAALAAERLVCAAESIGLGACYIGAARNDVQAMAQLLQLSGQQFALFGLCLGFPDSERMGVIKPRLQPEDVWFRETYRVSDTAEYDSRMAVFYAEQGMPNEETWSEKSAKRATQPFLGGRERILEWVHTRGWLKR